MLRYGHTHAGHSVAHILGARCGIPHGYASVSYTHLDVYKRQVMNNDAMDEIANDPESPWLLSVCNEIVNNCVNQAVPFRCDMMWETGCADSIDVYKRQPQGTI